MFRLLSAKALLFAVFIVCDSTANAQLLESVDLAGKLVERIAVYRDLQVSGKYFIVPLRLAIAKVAAEPAICIQYFDDDSGPQKRKSAAVTMSIAFNLADADLEIIKGELLKVGPLLFIAALPVQYKLSYFAQATAGMQLNIVPLSAGNFAAGSTIAITF